MFKFVTKDWARNSESHTSVFNKARRHLITSSNTVSSTSLSFFLLPPLLTRRANRSLSTFIPDSVVTKSSIQARLAVDRWTRNEMRCLTSFVSVVRPLRIPVAYQLAVFSVSLAFSIVPPEDDHQLLHRPPVACGCKGAGDSGILSAWDLIEIDESRRLAVRSTLERGDSGGDGAAGVLAPQPAMEKRFMRPESPVS